MRPLSKIAPDWWDYTTLDREILNDAAHLTVDDLCGSRAPVSPSSSTIHSMILPCRSAGIYHRLASGY
jgi:hypothetical protein